MAHGGVSAGSEPPPRPGERPGADCLELTRWLILGHKTPTELLYMLVQIDSVCSSGQSRENYVTISNEIQLPTSLIKS